MMYNYKELGKKYHMNFQELVNRRKSKRSFYKKAIEEDKLAILNNEISKINESTGLNFQLVINDDKAFENAEDSYGLITGVNNYLALTGENNILAEEMCGYYGEIILLLAVHLGLDTCWIGGKFDDKNYPIKLRDNDTVHCCIAIGYSEPSFKDVVMNKILGFKEKSLDHITTDKTQSTPSWFEEGLEYAYLAPSSLNTKPIIYSYNDLKANVKLEMVKKHSYIDLGVSKLHFEIGADCGKWNFGDEADFVFEK